MAPTLVGEPFHHDGWVYEEKVDGWRMLAYKAGDRIRLVSRNGTAAGSGLRSQSKRDRSCW
jgi:ATP-dependent DNA ligase